MFAITFHGNQLWSIYYHGRIYKVSDTLTAATVLGIAHNLQALKALQAVLDSVGFERTLLIVHTCVKTRHCLKVA